MTCKQLFFIQLLAPYLGQFFTEKKKDGERREAFIFNYDICNEEKWVDMYIKVLNQVWQHRVEEAKEWASPATSPPQAGDPAYTLCKMSMRGWKREAQMQNLCSCINAC